MPPSAAAAPDVARGVALAVASAMFIGTSFVIKKKGLQAAGGLGLRAADGGFSYLASPLWWTGLATMAAGEACNVVAYAYAPAALVTPLGALSVLVAALLAHGLLGDRLDRDGWIGVALCVVGSTLIVTHVPAEPVVTSVDDVVARAARAPFVAFCVAALGTALWLAVRVDPVIGAHAPWCPVAICSLVGGVSVCGVQAVAVAARLSLGGARRQFHRPAPWLATLFTAAAVTIQLAYLNRALDRFGAAAVTPTYYALFTTATLAAARALHGGRFASAAAGAAAAAGLALTIAAVVLLHSTAKRQQAEEGGVQLTERRAGAR